LSKRAFTEHYGKWCKKDGYHYSADKAEDIYVKSCGHVATLSKNHCTKFLVTQAIQQLNTVSETLSVLINEMRRLSALLPEYPVVMAMHGVGGILVPQLMSEIGEV